MGNKLTKIDKLIKKNLGLFILLVNVKNKFFVKTK